MCAGKLLTTCKRAAVGYTRFHKHKRTPPGAAGTRKSRTDGLADASENPQDPLHGARRNSRTIGRESYRDPCPGALNLLRVSGFFPPQSLLLATAESEDQHRRPIFREGVF